MSGTVGLSTDMLAAGCYCRGFSCSGGGFWCHHRCAASLLQETGHSGCSGTCSSGMHHCCLHRGTCHGICVVLRPGPTRVSPFALQGAQLTVLAFPHELRVFGVADCVALDGGQPSAAELLAQGAAEVTTTVDWSLVQRCALWQSQDIRVQRLGAACAAQAPMQLRNGSTSRQHPQGWAGPCAGCWLLTVLPHGSAASGAEPSFTLPPCANECSFWS